MFTLLLLLFAFILICAAIPVVFIIAFLFVQALWQQPAQMKAAWAILVLCTAVVIAVYSWCLTAG